MFFKFLGNGSIVNIAIASSLLLFITIISKRIKPSSTVWWALMVLSTILLLHSRAALLGFIAGFYFLNNYFRFIPLLTKIKRGWLFLSGILLTSILFFLKQDSSQGRLLIYKISATIFKDHPFVGIGLGTFKVQYNLHQAAYFAHHNINSREALLADNTFYAFNDVWQLLIALGTFRFLLLGAILFLIIRYGAKQVAVIARRKHLFYGAAAAFICILIASLFSYPLQLMVIQLLSLVYLVCILFSIAFKKRSIKPVIGLSFFRTVGIAGILYFGWCCFSKWKTDEKKKEAFDLARTGFKSEALRKYESLVKQYPKDGVLLFAYAKQLYYTNQLHNAKETIAKAKQYYTDNELYRFSATIEQDFGNFKEAEKDYLTALYMVPNRMQSRFALFQFYLYIKDTTKAIAWGNSIETMPIKIPSERTANMLRQTKEIMQKIK